MTIAIKPFLDLVAKPLASYLESTFFAYAGADWWQVHILNELTFGSRGQVRFRGITELDQLDLAALLRLFERNWYHLREWTDLPQEVRTLCRQVTDLRNADAHSAAHGEPVPWATTYRNLDTLERFAASFGSEDAVINQIRDRKVVALAELAGETFPGARTNLRTLGTDVGQTDAVTVSDAQNVELDELPETAKEPAARVIGKFRLHGPEDSIETEISTFNDRSADASEIPWRVTGPGGLEFKVHVILIDDPDEGQEVGQVICDSRLGSPPQWDEVVRRLRIGIWMAENGALYMDMGTAVPKKIGRASRRVLTLDKLEDRARLKVEKELLRLGATGVGLRGELTGDTNPRTISRLCVTFEKDDLLTPIAAWVSTTLAPLA